MSIGIHIATDVISTATLSRGGDFVFYEQIETPIDDTNALCRGIAGLVEGASGGASGAVSVAVNAGFGGQRVASRRSRCPSGRRAAA